MKILSFFTASWLIAKRKGWLNRGKSFRFQLYAGCCAEFLSVANWQEIAAAARLDVG